MKDTTNFKLKKRKTIKISDKEWQDYLIETAYYQALKDVIKLLEEYKIEKEPLCEQNVLINLIITKIK